MYSLLLIKNGVNKPSGSARRRTGMGILHACFILSFGVLLLAGCGGRKTVRTAKKQIRAANSAISHADSCASDKDYGMALASLGEAKAYATKGRKVGSSRDKRTLKGILERISRKTSDYELKKKRHDAKKALAKQAKEEADALTEAAKKDKKDVKTAKKKPKTKRVAPVDIEMAMDPTQRAKLADEAKKAKKRVTPDDLEAAMNATDKPKVAENDAASAAAAKPIAGGDAKGEVKAAVKDEGPYRPYGKNRPTLSIDKVTSQGDFALCYFQLYNKNPQNNRRIGRVEVVFKDAGNGRLFETRYIFVYKKFSLDKKDLTDQDDPMAALTGGSHEVFAGKTLKLVAVQEHKNYAKKAAKVALTVHYEDGSSDSDTGPGSLVDPVKKKSALPGL